MASLTASRLLAPIGTAGNLFAFGLDVARNLFKRPFQLREFIQQAWFIASVTIVPTALVAIPFGAVIALQVGGLIKQFGAQSFTGSAAVLAVVREAGPIATSLLIAGAGGSAIAADLGARKIREELDAMMVLGIDPIQRLVVPRVLACMLVAFFLNGLVSVVGVVGGYFFNVVLQDGTPGAYLASFTALAQLPDLWQGMAKALVFGLIAAIVACYKGMNAARRPEGCRRRGERVRGDHVHAAVRRQLRDVGHLLPARSTEDRVSGMANVKSLYQRPLKTIDSLGEELAFFVRALAWTPRAVRRYKKEIMRLLAEVTLGSGALAVIGGTVGVITAMAFFTGTEVGLQGYASLNQIGTAAFSGFVSAYFNTREISPLVAGIALAATVGCGFTAQLGAMRISEEVDALEVMAIPSLPFLVTTRIIAGLIAITPLYVVGLLSSYFATRLVVTQFFGQSPGTYDHYFNQFLPPGDVLWSFGKVLVFAVVVVMIHCYHGYTATGGPAGVGVAVGRAVRTSIVAINVIDLFLSMAIWGANTTVRLAG